MKRREISQWMKTQTVNWKGMRQLSLWHFIGITHQYRVWSPLASMFTRHLAHILLIRCPSVAVPSTMISSPIQTSCAHCRTQLHSREGLEMDDVHEVCLSQSSSNSVGANWTTMKFNGIGCSGRCRDKAIPKTSHTNGPILSRSRDPRSPHSSSVSDMTCLPQAHRQAGYCPRGNFKMLCNFMAIRTALVHPNCLPALCLS